MRRSSCANAAHRGAPAADCSSGQALPERGGAAVGGVPEVRRAGRGGRETPDGEDAAAAGEGLQKGARGLDLRARGPPVRALGTRMRRDRVPEQHARREPELVERALDDRGRRLRRARAGELALGGEGDAADPGSPEAGRLADEQKRRAVAALEVGAEPLAQKLRPGILVERRPDAGGGEALYELQRFQRTSSSIGFRGRVPRLERSGPSSGAGCPSVRTHATPTSSGISNSSLNAAIRSCGTP